MVPFSACRAVLLPFLDLVVWPALHAPGSEAISFTVLFLVMYCVTYLFYPISTLPEHLHSTLLSHAKTT